MKHTSLYFLPLTLLSFNIAATRLTDLETKVASLEQRIEKLEGLQPKPRRKSTCPETCNCGIDCKCEHPCSCGVPKEKEMAKPKTK